MSSLSQLLGESGSPAECRKLTPDIAMHWFPTGSNPGTPCVCGETTKDRRIGPKHDDKCESEFIFGPMVDSPCGCADRVVSREQ